VRIQGAFGPVTIIKSRVCAKVHHDGRMGPTLLITTNVSNLGTSTRYNTLPAGAVLGPIMIANKRRPNYRATLEDDELDLRSFLAELVESPPLTSHRPPLNRTSSTRIVSHIIAAALTSPYREADFYPKATPSFRILPFNRQTLLVDLLGVLDEHGEPDFKSRRAPVEHLELDMCQPAPTMNERRLPKFHPQDLA